MTEIIQRIHPDVRHFAELTADISFVITNSALCICDDLHHPTCPCGAGSLCDECDTTIYGQDEHRVRANFDRLRGLDPNWH